MGITFYCPSRETFPAVSVTGTACSLDCAHCGGHYLGNMAPIEDFSPGPKTRGCLISGGCDKSGSVPLPFEKLRALKGRGLILNIHTGLLGDYTARRLEPIADVVSIDVVGDEDTIKSVYGIDKTPEDYRSALSTLKKHKIKFAAHVCIGLNNGGYSGEDRAFEIIREFSDTIILLLLIPTRGTRFAEAEIDIEHALKMIRLARQMFPSVIMGCMRPRIREIEKELLTLDGIVRPQKWLRAEAERRGLEIRESGVCCACE